MEIEKHMAAITKPIMSGSMKSTQCLEADGCTRCRECMKLCQVFSVHSERLSAAPMHKNAKWRELLAKNNNLRAKIFGGQPLFEDEVKQFIEDKKICTTAQPA